MKEEYSGLEYNLTTSELELVNVSASWDEVCLRPFVEPKRNFCCLLQRQNQHTCLL